MSFSAYGAQIAHHPYLKLPGLSEDGAGSVLPCHYFATLEFGTAILCTLFQG